MIVTAEKLDLGTQIQVGDHRVDVPRGGSIELSSESDTQVLALVRTETGAAVRELKFTDRGDDVDVSQRDL